MGCNCRGRNAIRNVMPVRSQNGNILRPVTGPKSAQGGLAAAPTPTSLKAAMAPTAERSSSGLNQEKRKIQKIRRDAIRRALSK